MRQTLLQAASLAILAAAPASSAGAQSCGGAGLSLPRGFCATVFADHIGHARHMAVAPNGVVYVNTWSGRYYGGARPPAGGFVVALQDADGDGRAENIRRFGATPVGGGAGGTGIAIYGDGLYVEESDKILRYSLPKDDIAPTQKPETVVSGLPLTGDHPMHPFVIDAEGNLYLDSGSATNSCQARNRMRESPGLDPAASSRPARAYGATTPGRRIRNSRLPGVSRRACAMAKASPWMAAASTSRSTAAISSPRTGRGSLRPSRVQNCQRRNWSS